MKYRLTTPFRTEFLFSILIHVCVLILIGYGMDTVRVAKKGRYIAVELVRPEQAKRAPKAAAKPKATKPVKLPEPVEPLPINPRFTEHSEEPPVTEHNEDASLMNEGDNNGPEEIGETDIGFGDEDIEYTPFHRVSVLPSFKVQINPVYPPSERAAGTETKVIVEVYINEQGAVDRVEIIRSGGRLFDEAVIDAVRESSFTPAVMDGRLVAVRVKIPYTFKLK